MDAEKIKHQITVIKRDIRHMTGAIQALNERIRGLGDTSQAMSIILSELNENLQILKEGTIDKDSGSACSSEEL